MWVAQRQQLFWLDLARPTLHCFDTISGYHRSRSLPASTPLGALVGTTDTNRLLLAAPEGIVLLNVDTLTETPVCHPARDDSGITYNDGGVDRSGHLWIGTADRKESSPIAVLYRIDGNESTVMDDNFVVCNGPVFSQGGRWAFVSDSLSRRILRYTLNPLGEITDKQVIILFSEEQGYPDGLALDDEGGLWVAHWGGGQITRWTIHGQLTHEIPVPTPNVTSLAFGGVGLDRLFITTAADGEGGGGDLYSAVPGARGLVEALYVPFVP